MNLLQLSVTFSRLTVLRKRDSAFLKHLYKQISFLFAHSFPLEDGSIATFTYVADENGYRVESPLLPALPDFVQQQIAFAEEQRARGITFD